MRVSRGKEKGPTVIRSGIGSFNLIKKSNSKGLFYCEDPETHKIMLIENIKSYNERVFDTIDQLEKYIKEVYY